MIYSTLSESKRIEGLHPKFKQLFDYVKEHDFLGQEIGRITLDDDNLFINNVNPQLLPADEQVLEVHRRYLDVHIPLDKAEIIGIKALEHCSTLKSEYNSQDDCALYAGKPDNYITVQPGEFLIVYPEDAHAPIIGEGKIRKLVVKVMI
ncbi:MAG TPA: YhcH/YjgK/YiaL family protein [Paludibacteraceae bacterium]|nr:YhcH/YjgK/YiaL family protein [Paludibacteraceae bacterium]HPT44070.1 YhcH/YjgK/YiaL family protein [Paludibacteraceae bacterium]